MTVSEYENVQLGTYLFHRLSQVNNLKSIFGVPGDFNLPLLEHIYNIQGLNWVGCCNELNAGYAADGYSRLHGLGVVVTTYGVGELSALNAISGAFAENAPVLHIVGTSSTGSKAANNVNLHHLIPHKETWKIGQDHYVYEKMVEPFCVISESLNTENMSAIQSKIDNVIETIYRESKPGYIFLPVDMANLTIPVKVSQRLDLSQREANNKLSDELTEKIIEKLYTKRFCVLGDSLLKNRMCSQLNHWLQENSIHSFTTILGKSVIDEFTRPELFHGVFAGPVSTEGTNDDLSNNGFELGLHIGYNQNEVSNIKRSSIRDHIQDVVELGKDFVSIDNKIYENVNGFIVLDKITKRAKSHKLQTGNGIKNSYRSHLSSKLTTTPGSKITQQSLLKTLQSIIKPDDILVVEMCSFLFNIPDLSLPPNVQVVTQNFYGSIGYALPATLGVSLSLKDRSSNSRVILIEGDGSSQMTIQELTSYIRYDINPTVLLLNNEGYSVERAIMGETRSYNDIAPGWKWTKLFEVFGDVEGKSRNVKVESNVELQQELNMEFGQLRLIEIRLEKMDVPWRFNHLTGKA